MKIARVFLIPDGGVWFDVPLRPDQNCEAVFSAMRGAGAIVMPEFIVPAASVHHAQLIVMAENAQSQPAYTLPDSDGKPN
jgi:hypothetical protein